MRLKLDHPEDEIERWNAVRYGDALSFKWLYLRYFQPLYAYGKKIGVPEQALQDSIHDVFVDLWFYRENLSEIQSVKLYLFRTWRRKVNRHVSTQLLIDSLESLIQDEPAFEDSEVICTDNFSEGPERQAQSLRKVVNDLSPRHYEALVLRCYEAFTNKEIADVLDVDEDNANMLVEHGLDQLKQFAKLVMSIALIAVWNAF